MSELKDILIYILQHYPHEEEMSNARVTKMVYLSDWKHVLERGQQISGIRWYFDNFGPFVWDIMRTATEHPDLFRIEHTATLFGNTKALILCADPSYQPELSASEEKAIDHVVTSTQALSWDQFIKLVYSTYPIVSTTRYEFLDLNAAAREYKQSPLYRSPVSV